MLEKHIQQTIITYLQYLENQGKVYFFRNNSFAGFTERRNGTKGYIKNNKPGMPDIIVCYKGKWIGLEIKNEKGKQSDFQKEAEIQIKKAGGEYYIVRSVEEVESLIKINPHKVI